MLKLSHPGTIRAWRTDFGHDVFFPQTIRRDGKCRGGAFVAAPVFGEVPQTKAWEGVILPRHGTVRSLSSVEPVWCQNTHKGFIYSFPFSQPTPIFPWRYIVQISIVEGKDSLHLAHRIEVTRQVNCTNPRPMPLMFGLCPYFATYERKETVVKYGRETKVTTTDDLSSAQQFGLDGRSTTFAVDGGVIVMNTSGYDQMNIWTDDPSQYLCVEPTLGNGAEVLLAPGESRCGSCNITYIIDPYYQG